MRANVLTRTRQRLHRAARAVQARLPRDMRFALMRRLVQCDPSPDASLVVKIAETREELEACFRLLHDAYVGSGFMQPHPSGLRVTPWHALPTTTTICALVGGEVVGTLSMVREGVFGLPLQSAFELAGVRARPGQLAEISALAVRRDYRRTGGAVLFPLMKFMYEYCTRYFDTRHLVIAVNPDKIELCEAVLLFERLDAQVVESYSFANGAAAVGATLDLAGAPQRYAEVYGRRRARKNLHHYFTRLALPQLQLPARPYFTTNDPVMTPALLDEFFNRRTQVFASLNERQRGLLRQIYDAPGYAAVLPTCHEASAPDAALRRHPRHSIRFPAHLTVPGPGGVRRAGVLRDISAGGCQLELTGPGSTSALAVGHEGALQVRLGAHTLAEVRARIVRAVAPGIWGLAVDRPDAAWRACVSALAQGATYRELAPGAGIGPIAANTAAPSAVAGPEAGAASSPAPPADATNRAAAEAPQT
jgi:hypothetical protein